VIHSFTTLLIFSSNEIIICSIHPAKDIRPWLVAPDSSKNKNEAHDKRQVDTCAWFLGGERFRMWQKKPVVKGKRMETIIIINTNKTATTSAQHVASHLDVSLNPQLKTTVSTRRGCNYFLLCNMIIVIRFLYTSAGMKNLVLYLFI
jgi:hypothetical protein